MHFDLRKSDKIVVEIIGQNMRGRLIHAPTVLDIISEITVITGRMKALPDWTHEGAIIGLEGGDEEVYHIASRLIDKNVKVAGIWLQDWVGIKKVIEGDRLCWCWTLNRTHYTQWGNMTAEWFNKKNIRTLSYINPYFSIYEDNILHVEGTKGDYFVKNRQNQAYDIHSGTIKFHMVDLTNPAARLWMKNIIKTNMILNTGVYGWMTDFGEHLPVDAVLFDGSNALDYHNKFPLEWAKINSEAIEETGRNDLLFFMRSGSLESSKYAQLYWLGDQMVTWDKHDGIKSVLTAYLSGGISGNSLTHTDIGGYTQFPLFFVRTKELLMRWIEFSTFGSAIFRTHVGSSLSKENKQIYNDADILEHFVKFVDIFVKLKDYRYKLMVEAETYGTPLMRPLSVHYDGCWNVTDQYLFGADIMVKPVLDYNVRKIKVYLPENVEWVHLWSNQKFQGNVLIEVPLGQPAIFYNNQNPGLRELFSEQVYEVGAVEERITGHQLAYSEVIPQSTNVFSGFSVL